MKTLFQFSIVLLCIAALTLGSCQTDEIIENIIKKEKENEVDDVDDVDEETTDVVDPPETEEPDVTDENPEPTPPVIPKKHVVVGPQDAISTIPYSQIPNKEYTIDVVEWDIPNNRSDVAKTTDNLQAAIDWAHEEGYGIIRMPEGHFLVGKEINGAFQQGISLPSNTAFLLHKNTIIEMAPNDKWNYCAINVSRQKYVTISGGTIIGDKENHIYKPRSSDGSIVHDEGHLICVQTSSENVTIENVVLTKANGDGILLVGQDGKDSFVSNITIRNNNIGFNRRQGISVVGGKELVIENNEIHHTRGTAPQYGIDIESFPYESENIDILSNYFHHNSGDLLNFDGRNVVVDSNVFEQGEGNSHLDAPFIFWDKADMTITNNCFTLLSQSRVSNWNAVLKNSFKKPEVVNKTPSIINGNTFNQCGIALINSLNTAMKNNKMTDGHITVVGGENIEIFDNTISHPNECWAYRLKDVTGAAGGNIYNDKSVTNLLLSDSTPFTGACQK